MSYGISFEREAEEDLARCAPMLASYILDQIDRLAEDPVGLSRPPSFPHPLFPKFQFTWPPDAPIEAFVTVLFQYSQDETTLHILMIGVIYR